MRDPIPENLPLYEYTHLPTHMRALFSPEEMRTMTIAPPFSFTKGAPVMRIDALPGFQSVGTASKFGTRLYDLWEDPTQQSPIQDENIESRMLDHMRQLMEENDCPTEQFSRLGMA